MAVCGHDQIGSFGDGFGWNNRRIIERDNIQACGLRHHAQSVVGGGHDDARDLDAFLEQALERGGAEITGADKRQLHPDLSGVVFCHVLDQGRSSKIGYHIAWRAFPAALRKALVASHAPKTAPTHDTTY